MIGILVHGDNHFIVRGPLPSRPGAVELVRHWSLIRIGSITPPHLEKWTISTEELRENLEWAVMLSNETAVQPAVEKLLNELKARAIKIHHATGPFLPASGDVDWTGED